MLISLSHCCPVSFLRRCVVREIKENGIIGEHRHRHTHIYIPTDTNKYITMDLPIKTDIATHKQLLGFFAGIINWFGLNSQ